MTFLPPLLARHQGGGKIEYHSNRSAGREGKRGNVLEVLRRRNGRQRLGFAVVPGDFMGPGFLGEAILVRTACRGEARQFVRQFQVGWMPGRKARKSRSQPTREGDHHETTIVRG
jgi:hypothetical protein